MKKHIYLLLSLLTLHPTLATQKIITSTIIASTLALSHTTQQPSPNTQQPRNLHDLDEKYILNLILNNSLRKAKIKKHLPSELRGLIHTFFIHEWTIHGFHKDTGTTYDPHDFDINGIHKQTQTILNPRGFTQNGNYKDVSPKTNKPTKYDPQGYNIDRWNKDGTHENGEKLDDDGFTQHTHHANLALYQAIETLDTQAVRRLLTHPHLNINFQDDQGNTPLHLCCAEGNEALQIAQLLLAHKEININLQNESYCTPLHFCCGIGDEALQITQLLLSRKEINIKLSDNRCRRPIHHCSLKGDKALQITQLLLSRKEININLQTSYGTTPLHNCCETGDKALQIATTLLKRKEIKINLQDDEGNTSLDYIIKHIQECMEDNWPYTYINLWNLLVAKGARLNTKIEDYQRLNPNNFQEPHRTYIRLIKQNPPKN